MAKEYFAIQAWTSLNDDFPTLNITKLRKGDVDSNFEKLKNSGKYNYVRVSSYLEPEFPAKEDVLMCMYVPCFSWYPKRK